MPDEPKPPEAETEMLSLLGTFCAIRTADTQSLEPELRFLSRATKWCILPVQMNLNITRRSERADARANRARLVEAARAVFSERGLAAEMKEIAERAGVGVGTIYRNFPSKEDLILAIMRDALAGAIAEARLAESMDDPVDGLRALLASAFAMIERYGWLVEAMLGGQFLLNPQMRAELERHKYLNRFERLIQNGVDQGRLRPDLDIAVAAAMLAGATTPRSHRHLLAGRPPEQAADAVITSFLRGAASDASA
jgi:AcrR family transcriptional regulator